MPALGTGQGAAPYKGQSSSLTLGACCLKITVQNFCQQVRGKENLTALRFDTRCSLPVNISSGPLRGICLLFAWILHNIHNRYWNRRWGFIIWISDSYVGKSRTVVAKWPNRKKTTYTEEEWRRDRPDVLVPFLPDLRLDKCGVSTALAWLKSLPLE